MILKSQLVDTATEGKALNNRDEGEEEDKRDGPSSSNLSTLRLECRKGEGVYICFSE